jgi:hypothetical protein
MTIIDRALRDFLNDQKKGALIVRPLRVYICRDNQAMIVIVAIQPNRDDDFLSR